MRPAWTWSPGSQWGGIYYVPDADAITVPYDDFGQPVPPGMVEPDTRR